MDNKGKAQGEKENEEEYVSADKKEIAFWADNNQKRRKNRIALNIP